MDIEKFDRLYPSPAHAAAADWSDRYAPKHLKPESKSFLVDRSGIVIGVAALAAAFLGGAAYVLTVGQTVKKYPKKTIQVATAVPAVKRLVPLAPVMPPSVDPTVTPRRTNVADAQARSAPERKKVVSTRKGSSGWILDPLSGDALAAALVIDKQRTIELNAQQLGTMTKSEIRPPRTPGADPRNDPGTS